MVRGRFSATVNILAFLCLGGPACTLLLGGLERLLQTFDLSFLGVGLLFVLSDPAIEHVEDKLVDVVQVLGTNSLDEIPVGGEESCIE